MENNPSMNEPASEKVGMTAVEEFMANGYEFRKNVLSDKYEMREINGHWRVVTRESINSISRRLKREVDEEKNWRSEVEEYIHSEETPCYDPIVEYLDSLPTWDGKDRVRELFRRLPGANDEQLAWLAVWLRSAVAHWLHLDPLHGNENIVTLIGPQGCGKTTFCCQLLPPQFRSYYLDHVNLGNKFDKEMALTNNLLVNIDELDQIKPGKQAELKQMVSKNKVNGRPIFGRAQNDRFRFASFVATTNNPRPLHDPTGSRRYLCVEIPHGSIICNELPIEYDQIFAQVVYELRDQHLPYWFTPAEVIRIEKHNAKYQFVGDLESMITSSFRHPMAGEEVKPMLTRDVVSLLSRHYPELKQTQGMNVKVGRVLKALNFEQKGTNQGSAYFVVPMQLSA